MNLRKFNEHRAKVVRERRSRPCLGCGGSLWKTVRYNAKYCSAACRSASLKRQINNRIDAGDTTLATRHYRRYLLEKYGPRCMDCGWDKINPITNKCPVDMDHIDGNSSNNKLDNLKLLCPNCHSLTPTYKALNRGNGRASRKQRYKEKKSY